MSSPDPDQAQREMGGLTGLPGLESVREQLAGAIAVTRAELARREAGVAVARAVWKNLVFTGGPGSGKSRAAAAVGRMYREIGVLSSGHLTEVASADLVGTTSQETGQLVREAAARSRGGVLLITDAHAYAALRLPDQQVLRCLREVLNDLGENLVVILAGQADELRALLRASPALASRFPAVISFPGYTARQLGDIFAVLAGEAGLSLTPAAARKVSLALGRLDVGPAGGSARLAVRLLDEAIASQARRVTASGQPEASGLCTIDAVDIPARVPPVGPAAGGDAEHTGQYL